MLKNVKYSFLGISDHAAMKVKIGIHMGARGGGVWCLNSSILLEEAYKENIRKCML